MKNCPRILLVLFFSFLACVSAKGGETAVTDPQIAAVQGLARRILPHRGGDIEFRIVPSERNRYTIGAGENGGVLISADNANSLAAALGDYLRDECRICVTWYSCDRVREPRRLPVPQSPVSREAVVGHRFFLNYCTYGYTLNFWNWEQWERLIDWMALNGVTMALAGMGQEAVWQKVWMDFGLTQQQTLEYFVGPSYLPWHRMTNVDSWHGPMPQGWIDAQKELEKKIIEREISLGISPILSMFTGHVPRALKDVCPEADIRKLSAWGDFEEKYNPWYLSPSDPLFGKIAAAYLSAQKEMFGQDCHIYGVDLFNEVDPPVWDAEYLSEVAAKTYETMSSNDPDAVWLQMSWMFWHKKRNWTPDLVKAYISPVPRHRLIMLDYYCDRTELWRETDAFHGQDYIWSYLGNFGGNTMIAGNLDDISAKIDRVGAEGGEGFVGLGCTLEGLDVNPVMYEYVLDRAWTSSGGDDAWIEREADSRAGFEDENYRAAWDILHRKVYRDIAGNRASMVSARPTLAGKSKWCSTFIAYDNKDLLDAWSHLVRSEESSSPAWKFDCVNIARQCISNHFGKLYTEFCSAYKAGDLACLERNGEKMLDIVRDLDRLTASDNCFLLGKWTAEARRWAVSEEEKDYYDWDARAIVSCWGFQGGKLNDYANREWNGLLGTYYLPRWEKFIGDVCAAVEKGEPFDEEGFTQWSKQFEWDWVSSTQKFRKKAKGNPARLSRKLYGKYAAEISGE